MPLNKFKRFRMQIELSDTDVPAAVLNESFEWIPWCPDLLETHAEVKYRSFHQELDSQVFPCLGRMEGCLQLMKEISSKSTFRPEATWLVAQRNSSGNLEYCGTIQGLMTEPGLGTIQNLGVVPIFRGQGLGRALLGKALQGFKRCGANKASLEVTSDNITALGLYQSVGFHKARTVYKVSEASLTGLTRG